MAKKKFAIRSLFTGRAAKSGVSEEVAEYASDSDDLNDAHPFDPTQVNRPPKLDDRTEAELRRVCALVVENLKPSGYDLEDTRMQSDILVDNPNLDPAKAVVSKPKPPVPQPDATWYLDSSTRNSQFVNPRNVVKSPDKRGSTYRISGIASEQAPHPERSSKFLDSQGSSVHRPIDHTESPRAPLASGTLSSRDLASPLPKQANYTKSRLDPLNAPSSSGLPENRPASSSTNGTSVNLTPSTTSKRTSDNVKVDANPGSDLTGTGPWMKEEVDRRIVAERQSRGAISTTDSNFSTDDPSTSQVQSVGEAQAISIRSGQMITSANERVRLTDVKSPTSHPLPTGDSSASRIVSGTLTGPFEQPQLVDDLFTPPHSSKISLPQSRQSEKAQDASQLAEDYQKSLLLDQKAPGEAANKDEPQPSTKSKDSSTSSRRVSNLVNRSASLSSQKSDGSKRGSKVLSPSSPLSPSFPKSSQNWPAPPKLLHSDEGIPQIPPIPDKHQLDESVVVKDFYKPTGMSRMKMYRRSGNADRYPAQPGDVQAADFDSFMSVVKDSSRPNTAASKADDNSTAAPASRPISNPEPVLPPKDQEHPTNLESATKAIGSTEEDNTEPQTQTQTQRSPQDLNPLPISNQPLLQTGEVKETSQVQNRQPLSPAVISANQNETSSPAIVSSSRTSISTPLPVSPHSRSVSMSKRNRGLKRLLSKLGSNERSPAQMNGYLSSRRKYIDGFAPGAYVPGHGVNGGIEENDEWFDEQACAAPVVGFGRGW